MVGAELGDFGQGQLGGYLKRVFRGRASLSSQPARAARHYQRKWCRRGRFVGALATGDCAEADRSAVVCNPYEQSGPRCIEVLYID
jgi:hypothetical protein